MHLGHPILLYNFISLLNTLLSFDLRPGCSRSNSLTILFKMKPPVYTLVLCAIFLNGPYKTHEIYIDRSYNPL